MAHFSHHRVHPVVFALAGFALCAGNVSAQRDARSAPHTIPELLNAVREQIQGSHIPGAAIAIVHGDAEPWVAGVGKAVVSGREIDENTLFRAGSITKSFVALALLKLQEEGKIDLNARLSNVASEVPVTNPWENTHPITVAMLLEHTAGFDDFPSGTQYQESSDSLTLLEQTKLFRKSLISRWPPGDRVAYSSFVGTAFF